MRRAIGMKASLVIGFAVLAGCGPEKELPKQVTLSTGRDRPESVPVPVTSDPEASRVVKRAIHVATSGHPERLHKAKSNRASLKGVVLNTRRVLTPRIRQIEAVWPHKLFQSDEYNDDGPLRLTIGVRRPVIWIRNQRGGMQPENVDPPDTRNVAEAYLVDAVGRHWMGLLAPLADPTTVVFNHKKQSVGGQTVDVINAAVQNCPEFTLWFDEKSGHLGRVDFDHVEYQATPPVAKTFNLADYKIFDGLFAPTKINYTQNGEVVEQWSVDKWEFPDQIDDAVFDPSK